MDGPPISFDDSLDDPELIRRLLVISVRIAHPARRRIAGGGGHEDEPQGHLLPLGILRSGKAGGQEFPEAVDEGAVLVAEEPELFQEVGGEFAGLGGEPADLPSEQWTLGGAEAVRLPKPQGGDSGLEEPKRLDRLPEVVEDVLT
jgi:hypothetical protein